MCQRCDQGKGMQATEAEKKTFPSAGTALANHEDAKAVELEVHFVRLEDAVGPVDVEPGEVVIDNNFLVSHQSPENLPQLVGMVKQLNNCSYGENPTDLLAAAAAINVNYANLRLASSEDELEEKLEQQKEEIAKLIVMAIGLFTTASKGRNSIEEATNEEVAEQLLGWTSGVTADLIGEKVENAISNTLNSMGLNPRAPL